MMVTAVIASLGDRASLLDLLQILSSCPEVSQIIISLPPKQAISCDLLSITANDETIKILNSPVKGQVAQRIYAFQQVDTEYIIQIDDDINLLKDNFTKFLQFCLYMSRKAPGNVYAPIQCDIRTKNSKRLSYLSHDLKPPRNFGLGGTYPFMLERYEGPFFLISSEWLPGGIVFSPKSVVNMTDYYKFPGPAIGEDLIDSVWKRRCRSAQLFIVAGAHCFIEREEFKISMTAYLRVLVRRILVARECLKIDGWSRCPTYMFHFLVHILGKLSGGKNIYQP